MFEHPLARSGKSCEPTGLTCILKKNLTRMPRTEWSTRRSGWDDGDKLVALTDKYGTSCDSLTSCSNIRRAPSQLIRSAFFMYLIESYVTLWVVLYVNRRWSPLLWWAATRSTKSTAGGCWGGKQSGEPLKVEFCHQLFLPSRAFCFAAKT